MKEIILIIGRTGSGKSTISKYLEQKYNLSILKSYTTRNKRNEEDNDHIFISKYDLANFPDELKAAKTIINNNHYFSLNDQLYKNDIYTIDPNGLYDLLKNTENLNFKYNIIYLKSEYNIRKERTENRNCNFEFRNNNENFQFNYFESIIENIEDKYKNIKSVKIINSNYKNIEFLYKEIDNYIKNLYNLK